MIIKLLIGIFIIDIILVAIFFIISIISFLKRAIKAYIAKNKEIILMCTDKCIGCKQFDKCHDIDKIIRIY